MNPIDRRKKNDEVEAFVGLLRRFVQYVGLEDIEAFESSLRAGTSIAAFGGLRLEALPFRKGLQNVALKLWRTDMETEGWIKSLSTDALAEVTACISVVFADARANRARQALWSLMTREIGIHTIRDSFSLGKDTDPSLPTAPQPAFGVCLASASGSTPAAKQRYRDHTVSARAHNPTPRCAAPPAPQNPL